MMTTTPTAAPSTTTRSLSEQTLLAFRERAAYHDAVGRYPVEDLADLRAAGWFTAALPEALGGLGLDLVELGGEQRRMARYSPATALSTSMHHYWVGLAADLHRMGCPGRTSSLGTWTTASWSPPGPPTRPVPSWCTASCRTGLRASQRCATGTPRGCGRPRATTRSSTTCSSPTPTCSAWSRWDRPPTPR